MEEWTFVSNDGDVMQIRADNYPDAMQALLSIIGWDLDDDTLPWSNDEDSL